MNLITKIRVNLCLLSYLWLIKNTFFASLHILMRAIPDGPVDAGRRLHRYLYRESRCQVRIGWQKNCALYSYKSVKICVNPRLMNYLCAYKASFCASLRLKNPFNQRNPRLNISSCSSYLRGEKIREISVNPWLINYLHAFGIFTTCLLYTSPSPRD